MGTPALVAVGGLALASAVFGWRQNRGGIVGGRISLPKVLWLNLALTVFFALPFVLWRDASLAPELRTMWGVLLLSFLIRGVIELYLIYVTISWKCVYGIGHDFFTLALALALKPAEPGGFFWLYCAVLLVEAGMARAFSKLADPKDGVYFASEEAKFRTVNRASWAASLSGYAALGVLLSS